MVLVVASELTGYNANRLIKYGKGNNTGHPVNNMYVCIGLVVTILRRELEGRSVVESFFVI